MINQFEKYEPLWLSQLRSAANFSLSHTWRSTRTQVHPQILLKSHISWLEVRAENEGEKIDAKAMKAMKAMEAMEAIRGGWYLGEEGFKLQGLMDKAEAKIRDRGSLAGAAVRAHHEKEAERIIRIVGAEIEK